MKVFRQKCLGSEYTRFRVNWVVIMVTQTIGISFFVITPSLHQFVTSSSEQEDDSIQPGLGLSETWYSWIISISSVGELFGAVTMGVVMKHTYSPTSSSSRFVVGVALGGQQAFFRVYLAESAATAEQLVPDKKKGALKKVLFFLAFTIGTASVASGPGLSAIAAQLPVDQFRWSGWFLCIHSGTILIMILVLFHERWNDARRSKGTARSWRPRCPKCNLLSLPIPWYTVVLIVVAFFTSAWFFAVLETLQNPLLSDNFGLSIKYSSYVILASSAIYCFANLMIYLLQRLHVDNRIICMAGLTLLTAGGMTLSDWQSIGGDPCVPLGELGIDGRVEFSGGLVVEGSRCDEVIVGEDTYGSLLGVSRNATPNDCLQQSTLSEANSTIVCLTDNVTGIVEEYNCYWPYEDLALMMELYNYDILYNSSLHNGSIKECDDPINCSCTSYQGCDYMLLIVEPTSVRTLEELGNSTTNALVKELDIDLASCLDNATISSQCVCESFDTTPGYECFWNPQSRVTGQYCERCLETCRSVLHSLNFIQAVVGLLAIGLGYPTVRIMLTLILSDCLGEESQGVYMGVLVASGSFSRLTGPLWGNPAYIAGSRRTWLPMTICCFIEVIVIIFCIALYHSMKPKQAQSYTLQNGSSPSGDALELVSHEELQESASESSIASSTSETSN